MTRIGAGGPRRRCKCKKRLWCSIAVGVLATFGLLSDAVTAQAYGSNFSGEGLIGEVVEGGVTCLPVIDAQGTHRVIVAPPIMSSHGAWRQPDGSAPVVVVGGTSHSGPGAGMHRQRVSYQATLYTWNGSGWVWEQNGPVVGGYTGTQAQNPGWDPGAEWSTWFDVAGGDRYYSVYYVFRWVPDELAPQPGILQGWAADYEDGRAQSCHIP